MRIRMSSYRQRASGEDANAMRLELGPITIWFSYSTPIAFQTDGFQRVVRRNDWGPTTGKHLNEISSDKNDRVSGAEFERLLEERVGKFFCPRDLDPSCPPEIVADWLEERGLSAAAAATRTA